MTDEPALLAAIRAYPDDDTPRLVYADWLQERGDADRAEFIRLQCAAARLPASDKERKKKEKAAESLLRKHRDAWFGKLWKPFHHPTKPAVGHLHIDRGFVTSLKGEVDDVLSLADDIARLAPCLRRIAVRCVENDLGKLLDQPFVRHAAELRFETLEPESVAVLLNHPGWGPLDVLELGFQLDDADFTLAGLGEAPLVTAARRLDVQYGYFIDDATGEPDDDAAQAPSLREMRRLRISRLRGFGFHGMSAESADAVAAWPGFKRLDTLDLGICNVEDATAVALLTAPTLPHLTRLLLNENDVGTPTVEAVAASPKLGRLTHLTFAWDNLRDPDAKRLADSATLPAALSLDVSFNHLTDRGVALLRERFGPGVVSREQLG